MTFFSFIADNQTKLLGGATIVLSTLVSLAAAGQLDGLIAPVAIQWLGIANVIVGALTGRAGFSNTTRERIAKANAEIAVAKAETAHAMEKALLAPSPETSPQGRNA